MINNPVINGVFTFDYPFYNDNIDDKKEFEECTGYCTLSNNDTNNDRMQKQPRE